MTSSPYLSHSSLAQQAEEPVTTHFASLGDLLTKSHHDARNQECDPDHQIIGIMHDEQITERSEIPHSPCFCDQHAERVHRDGEQTGEKGLHRWVGYDCRGDQNDCTNPTDMGKTGAVFHTGNQWMTKPRASDIPTM